MASFVAQKVAARGQKIRLGWENLCHGSEMLQKASELQGPYQSGGVTMSILNSSVLKAADMDTAVCTF